MSPFRVIALCLLGTVVICLGLAVAIVPVEGALPWLSYSLDPGTPFETEPILDVCQHVDVSRMSSHVRPIQDDDCSYATYRLDKSATRLPANQGFGPATTALQGRHGTRDLFIRPVYLRTHFTLPRYRRISGSPNLTFRKLPVSNTLVATNMGLALYEVDPLGYVVWQRAVGSHRNRFVRHLLGSLPATQEAEVYSSIESYGDRVLFTATNKNQVVLIDQRRDEILRSYEIEAPRSARLTSRGLLIAGGSPNGVVELLDPETGGALWRFDVELASPRDALLTRSGNIAIADTFRHRVLLVNPSTNALEHVWQVHGFPGGLTEASNGELFVACEHENQVYRLMENDDIQPVYRLGLLSAPAKIAVVGEKNLLVADSGHHRVVEIDQSGEVVWELTNLNDPMGVARR